MAILVPTVHLNGTSRDGLIEPICAAMDAIRVAIAAVGQAAPNGRDYYLQGAGAINEAIRQHNDRVSRLDAVRAELHHIAESIA